MRFRALWPITDPGRPLSALIAEASRDLPRLATRAHARLAGAGRWTVQLSRDVPGSGRITETVLVYDGLAIETTGRAYRRGSVAA